MFLLVVARLAAQALLRARLFDSERAARAEAEAARQRATFLAEASALLASSLEWEATLASVAKLAVPRIADWCSVEVPETLAAGARRSRSPTWIRPRWSGRSSGAGAGRPIPAAPSGPLAVIRTGRAELYGEIPDAVLVAQAEDAGAAPDRRGSSG